MSGEGKCWFCKNKDDAQVCKLYIKKVNVTIGDIAFCGGFALDFVAKFFFFKNGSGFVIENFNDFFVAEYPLHLCNGKASSTLPQLHHKSPAECHI